jgi:hypothetical protein
MKRTLKIFGGAMLMLLALLVPTHTAAAAAGATVPTGEGTVFSFALRPPNVAVAPSAGTMAAPGDWIRVTGHGTVNPATRVVRAGGTFVHRNADGTVHCRGTWTATALTGWTDFSDARSRVHGGVVSMLVTHTCSTDGQTHTGIPMTVTSTQDAPDGSSYVEGVTVGGFTEPTAGNVVIRVRGRHDDGGRA